MVLSKNDVKQSIMLFFVLSPFLLIYNYIFYFSMDYAKDRINYLHIMSYPFQGREEPLLHLFSYLLSFFIQSSVVKLMIIQNFFIVLLLFSLMNFYHKFNKSIVFIGCIFVLILLVFSNYYTTQLRLGYAISLILFIISIVDFNSKSLLKKCLIFLPVLMHFGTIFFSIFYLFFYYRKINSFLRFFYFLFFSILFITSLNIYLESIFVALGVDTYYLGYLDDTSDLNDGRAVPYTLIFYLLSTIFLIYHMLKNKISEPNYYFALSGYFLAYWGVGLGFYLAFKFLAPIGVYALILYAKELDLKNNILSFIFLFSLLFLFIIVFCFYSLHQTGVDLEWII